MSAPTIDRPIQGDFRAVTPALEAAFPERFVRDPAGDSDQRRPAPDQFRRGAARHAADRVRLLQAAQIGAAVAERRSTRCARNSAARRRDRPQGERRRASAEGGAPDALRRTERRPAAASAAARFGGGGGFFGGGNRGRLQFLADRYHDLHRPGDRSARDSRRSIISAAMRPARRAERRATRSRRRPAGRTMASARGSAPIGAAGRGSTVSIGTGALRFSLARDVRPAAVRQSRRAARPRRSSSRGCAARRCGSRCPTCSTTSPGSATPPALRRSTISRTCSTRSGGRSRSASASCSRRALPPPCRARARGRAALRARRCPFRSRRKCA